MEKPAFNTPVIILHRGKGGSYHATIQHPVADETMAPLHIIYYIQICIFAFTLKSTLPIHGMPTTISVCSARMCEFGKYVRK